MSTAATQVNQRLAKLTAAGVSIWLDQIRRTLITGGELARLVEEESLRGVTANPSIFEKAILGSDDYDEELDQLAREDLEAQEIYDRIAQHDVRMACDVLADVHREAHGNDGFVSLEVAPEIAYDTKRTLEMARVYWKAVNRPNLMIKIPGTPAGVPAIEQGIYEGINVNVTLLFAVEAYERVAEAYLRGLERRQSEGLSLDVKSVASFFVSRVDTNVDKKLDALGRTDLAGTAAVANARAAYRRFKEIFNGPRWEALRHGGATVQRPLWASTGTKNPDYSDVKYVEELVGAHTVNTMPLNTMMAFGDHGEVTGPTAERDPSAELEALAEAGIDMDQVTDELLVDGVKQFEEAMHRLLAGIEEERSAVITGRPKTIDAKLPREAQEAVAKTVTQAMGDSVAQRVWRRDASLWGGPGVPEIENRLGWLTVSDAMLEQAPELTEFASECRRQGFTDAVLLGMGGSSLGPEVLRQSFGEVPDGMRLQVLDSTHPDVVRRVQESVDISRTLFIVSSKSGGTIETLSHYKHFKTLAEPRQFVVVTDPGSPLERLAAEDQVLRTFRNTPDIGGRYSVLSLFGLVPAALMGINIEALLHRAQVGEQNCAHYDSSTSNSGLWLGAAIGELARQGRDKLTFIVSPPIESFGLWVEQLIAESTGKHGRGILPVADEPLGEPEDYGPDRVFIYLRHEDQPDEQRDAFVEELAGAGHPTLTLAAQGPADLGRIFFLSEFAVAVAGWVLEINPFDQPNVQEAKDNTKRVLDSGSVPEFPSASDDDLRALLQDANPPHYVAIMGYLPPSEELDQAVGELRSVIRAATGAAVTFGYGPRFLHSTGQLHKGGPPIGRFLQLVDDPRGDVAIEGESYSFGTLIAAQAAGDLQTLHQHGLPAQRVKLDGDPASAVRSLAERLSGLLSHC
ncbi:MAG TPA: bifunctional transaldolase/phosoglucose isomerase [Solirubrobacteraceae bacterium]|nr:bifunctional transaldolase/phosoglucose isomerase [Solirubrobacteraceae bacterium]